jgi:hypothetical protein
VEAEALASLVTDPVATVTEETATKPDTDKVPTTYRPAPTLSHVLVVTYISLCKGTLTCPQNPPNFEPFIKSMKDEADATSVI